MTWAEQQNQNIEGKNNQNKVQFEKNLADIKSILDTSDDQKSWKKLDDADRISNMLDCDFKNWLSKLGNKENVKDLPKMIHTALEARPDSADRAALETLQTFLLPFVVDVSEWMQSVDAEWKAEWYNKTEWKNFIKDFKTELEKEKYSSIPWIKTIKTALENPSIKNIQTLQTFLLSKTDETAKLAFYQSSWKWQKNATEIPNNNMPEPDWWFWPWTQAALKNYLDSFSSIYQKQTKETENIASETSNQNAQEQLENKQETKDSPEASKLINQEIAKDNSSEKAIDEANLAWVLTSAEVSKLNDKTLQIDGDNVVYRWEKIPFTDLGIARTKSIQPNTGTWLSNPDLDLATQNQSQEISNEMILDYLNWNNDSWLIWIKNKSSDQIRKNLATKKFEIDNKVDEQLRNSIIYDEINNEYKYRSQRISRDDIWEWKTTLQQRQNKIDRGYANWLNPERIVNTQTSTDGKTTRKIIDLAWDKWQKIIINKENSDWSTTKTVDAVRWDNSKVVTTQRDSEWNISNESKIKEDADSFKEKEKNRDMKFKNEPGEWKIFAEASGKDVLNALTKSSGFAWNYDIKIDWSRISMDAKDPWSQINKKEFLSEFNKVLKDAWIVSLDMQNYKFKWEKIWDTQKVDKLVFKVWEWTQKEIINPEFEKMIQIPNNWQRVSIEAGSKWYEYMKSNWEMYARIQDEKWEYQYQKFDSKNNKRINPAINPDIKAGWDDVSISQNIT